MVQFAWSHLAILLIITQSHLVMQNIYDGLVWYVSRPARYMVALSPNTAHTTCRFLLPSCLIVCNDIMAYMFGFFFGRTPLILISPKKTWEVSTVQYLLQ